VEHYTSGNQLSFTKRTIVLCSHCFAGSERRFLLGFGPHNSIFDNYISDASDDSSNRDTPRNFS
jgi:hypothetical protein